MDGPAPSLGDVRTQLNEANRRGEFLEAFNIVDHALQTYPDELDLRYAAVLALARSGATNQAERRYAAMRLLEKAPSAERALRVDILALRGRLLKDRARQTLGAERTEAYRAASGAYESVFRESGDAFPAVNAATLAFLAGDRDRARHLAAETTRALDVTGEGDGGDYYYYATRAEIALLANDLAALDAALATIVERKLGGEGARAATRRQLREICVEAGHDPSVLQRIAGPTLVHYTGHLYDESFDDRAFAAGVRRTLAEQNVGYGYGSLAAGSDIVIAEALLERNAALHIVLPFEHDEFRRVSVTSCGGGWGERFDRVLSRASSVHYATEDAYLGDDILFGYASRFAMGLALLRAQALDTEAVQIAMVDTSDADPGIAAGDVGAWRGTNRKTIGIHLPRTKHQADFEEHRAGNAPARVLRAMLFGDVRGFSKLAERQLPIFVTEFLGRFARVLNAHDDRIEYRNTWGDGLYVVMTDAASAASCALELQAAIADLDTAAVGLSADMGLRLGVHFGPIFPVEDPVLGRLGFMGSHVSKTARLEPVTPEGSVYVTESFAAAISLEAADAYVCEYVGRIPAAKNYGTMRVYALSKK